MKARAGLFVLLAAAALGFSPVVAAAQAAPDFGAPPSGEYPILFNDHHVYAKPDLDKQGRVLSALVRGKTILVPLRSMFEQMGADVAYDASTKTAVVSKPGSEIRVTVGKPEVVINGETRPLDVAPEVYRGTVVVPVRVISEAMGAYVQWVAEKRAVVVRYVPLPPPSPPPPPPPRPTAAPTPAVVPTLGPPPPTPAPPYYDKYIVADVLPWPRIYNDFNAGGSQKASYNVRAAFELSSPVIHLMFEGNFNRWQFYYPGGLPNAIGTSHVQNPTASFNGWDDLSDVNFGMRIAKPRIYFIEGYMWDANNYGYPPVHGLGYGIEKLPDLDKPFSITARYWYASLVKGPYGSFTSGVTGTTVVPASVLSYRVQKFLLAGDWVFTNHTFLDFGWQSEGWIGVNNAPGRRNLNGPFVGLGWKF